MKKSKGFTLVELLIVIVVVGVLAALVVVAYNGIQLRGRDATRRANVQAVARALEAYYALNSSYPPFLQPGNIGLNVPAWRTANLPGVPDSVLTAPGATTVALVNNATPTASQYGYRNGESCVQCPRFFLYWYSEVEGQVKTVISLNGQ